jgi:hypothetical protein
MNWNFSVCILLFLYAIVNAQAPDTLWTKHYGFEYDDDILQIKPLSDGGFSAIGYTYSSYGIRSDIYLLRLDSDGDTLWTSRFDFRDYDLGASLEVTEDGNFILLCRSFHDNITETIIIKVDSAGNEIWNNILDITHGRCIRSTSDGGYIIAGAKIDHGLIFDLYLAKADSLGNRLWAKTYGGDYQERAWDVRETSDGGFITVGWTEPSQYGNADIYVVRTDAYGDSIWSNTYGGIYDDEARSIILSDDGGYIIAGKIGYSLNVDNIAVLKIDSSGALVWTKTFPDFGHATANSIISSVDGGYVSVAWYYARAYCSIVIKIDDSGMLQWQRSVDGSDYHLYCRSIAQVTDEGYVIGGYHEVEGREKDIFLCKLAPEITSLDYEFYPLPQNLLLCQNTPNPFNASTTIRFVMPESQQVTLTIYDLLGRQVETLLDEYRQAGVHTVTYDASHLSSGVHFYRLQAGDKLETKRMILLK